MTSPSAGSADVAWVDVLPSMKRFLPEIRSQVGQIMPRAGQEAGASYGQQFTRSVVSSVESASAKVAAARRKEEDAAGKVRVAEAKLKQLRDSGRADSARLAAAEEGVARARRGLDAATEGTARSQRELTTAQQNGARATRQLDSAQDRAARSGGVLSRTFGGMTSGAKLLVGSLIGGGLISGFRSLYEQAAESARVGRLTEAVLRSTGGAANVTAGQVSGLATAISNKTGIDDEAIQSAENLLLTFTNVRNEVGEGGDVFNRASALAVDMSVAMGKDATSSARLLGRALNDPIRGLSALSRVGVQFTEDQKAQIQTMVESGDTMGAQGLILDALAVKFEGAAAAASTPFEKLKVRLGNVAEELGSYLIPAVDKAATWIMDDLVPAVRDGAAWFGDTFGPAVHVAWNVLGDLVEVGGGVLRFFGGLPGPVQIAVAGFAAWAIAGGRVLGFLKPLAPALTAARGTTSAFSQALGYARANGDGMGTVLRSVSSYAGGQAVSAFGKLARAIGPELGIAAATYVIADAVGSLSRMAHAGDAAREEVASLNDDLSRIDGNAARIAATASAIDDLRRKLREAREEADVGGGDLTAALGNPLALGQLKAGFDDASASASVYEQAIADLQDDQVRTQEAASRISDILGISSQRVIELADRYGVDLTTGAGQAYRALLNAQTATDGAGGAAGDATVQADLFAAEMQDVSDAADEARKMTDAFKLSLDVLTGATVETAQVEAAFYDAVSQADGALEGMNGSVLDGAGNLNVQSEAGRAAQDVLFGVRERANQLIATMIQHGATTEEVQARDAQLRNSFIQTARQMGISAEDAVNLANQILGIPPERRTEIEADTRAASNAVATFQSQVDNLHGKTVQIQANWANGGTLNGSMRFDFAEGGIVKFFADGGHESHIAQHAPAGAMRVWAEPETGGESYIPHAPSKRQRSLQIWAETGRILGAFADGGIRHFQDGGVSRSPNNPIFVRADFSPIQAFARQAAADVRKLLEPMTGAVHALAWAKTQVGKPYIWGGVGPAGYDCSGFISAVTNVMRGRSPYTRLGSTATMPWAGFRSGVGGSFMVGNSRNTGGGIGHMAGTLAGVNVESAGGIGVRVGGSARGYRDAIFPEKYAFVAHGGGTVPDGYGPDVPAYLAPRERILMPEQDDYFRRFVDAAEAALESAGHRALIGQVTIPVRDEGSATDALDQLWHRLRVADLGGAFAWLDDE